MRLSTGAIALSVFASMFSAYADDEKKPAKKEKAPRFTLMDSQDEPFAFSFPTEKPVLLTFADQGGSEQMEAWNKPLLSRYEGRVERRTVAWLEAIPTLMRGAVEKIIQTTYDYVLMDWTGAVAKRYRCKANAANVFLISKDGFILFEHHGKMTKKRLEEAFKILDKELEDAK